MKIWMVVAWHTPWVSHGAEPVALFLSQSSADAYASERNAKNGIVPSLDRLFYVKGELSVDEWEAEP